MTDNTSTAPEQPQPQPQAQPNYQQQGVPPYNPNYNQPAYGNAYGFDDTGALQNKINAILRCDMNQMGRVLELVARRGQVAYQVYNGMHTMNPADRSNARAEITRIESQIAQLLAL